MVKINITEVQQSVADECSRLYDLRFRSVERINYELAAEYRDESGRLKAFYLVAADGSGIFTPLPKAESAAEPGPGGNVDPNAPPEGDLPIAWGHDPATAQKWEKTPDGWRGHIKLDGDKATEFVAKLSMHVKEVDPLARELEHAEKFLCDRAMEVHRLEEELKGAREIFRDARQTVFDLRARIEAGETGRESKDAGEGAGIQHPARPGSEAAPASTSEPDVPVIDLRPAISLAWKSLPIETLTQYGLSESVATKLYEGGAHTLGEYDGKKKYPFIGKGKMEWISEAFEKFWAAHPEYSGFGGVEPGAETPEELKRRAAAGMWQGVEGEQPVEQAAEQGDAGDPEQTDADESASGPGGKSVQADPPPRKPTPEPTPEFLASLPEDTRKLVKRSVQLAKSKKPDALDAHTSDGIWRAGYDAGVACLSIADCPHKVTATEYERDRQDDWLRGWLSGKNAAVQEVDSNEPPGGDELFGGEPGNRADGEE